MKKLFLLIVLVFSLSGCAIHGENIGGSSGHVGVSVSPIITNHSFCDVYGCQYRFRFSHNHGFWGHQFPRHHNGGHHGGHHGGH